MIKLLNRESGFTLVEALMAQVILIIGAAAIWGLFVIAARFNAESEDKTIAANIAQEKMEEIINTPFRYIVYEHPAGETAFSSEPKPQTGEESPYWTLDAEGKWIMSLPEGRYQISYPGPDGEDSDPLRIKVTIRWRGHVYPVSSLSLDTIVSMTPGRF